MPCYRAKCGFQVQDDRSTKKKLRVIVQTDKPMREGEEPVSPPSHCYPKCIARKRWEETWFGLDLEPIQVKRCTFTRVAEEAEPHDPDRD